jgi:hypothetical protein
MVFFLAPKDDGARADLEKVVLCLGVSNTGCLLRDFELRFLLVRSPGEACVRSFVGYCSMKLVLAG